MANFVLQELPDEMTDGKKIVYPKMPLSNTCAPMLATSVKALSVMF